MDLATYRENLTRILISGIKEFHVYDHRRDVDYIARTTLTISDEQRILAELRRIDAWLRDHR